MNWRQKQKRKRVLWDKARRYTSKLRFQARLQRLAENNLKEKIILDD